MISIVLVSLVLVRKVVACKSDKPHIIDGISFVPALMDFLGIIIMRNCRTASDSFRINRTLK
jgi:hypothetical protein